MPPEPGPDRIAILVLGMHRSGTSAVTRLLGAMGATLPHDPIGESDDNRKGYFESRAVVAADDRLIRALRSSWFDPRPLDPARLSDEGVRAHRADLLQAVAAGFGDAPLFAMKDPRQCRFVPFLAEALAGGGIASRAVLVVRDPIEVAGSLLARDRTIAPYGALLWLRHMLDAERDTRRMPRAVVDYAALLEDWRAAAGLIAPVVGEGALDRIDAEAVTGFLDPALRRNRGGPALAEPLAGLVAAARAAFGALCRDDGPAARGAVDAVRDDLAAMPWLEGDIVHDELRHRRAPAPMPVETVAPSPPPPPLEPVMEDDEATVVRTIRHSGLFDAGWYVDRYPDVADSGLDPVLHYVRIGAPEGRNPSAHFNTAYYARQMARRRPAAAP